MSNCRSCGAKVFFAKHVLTGKRMIIDSEPSGDGNIVIEPDGKARVIAGRLEHAMYADRDRFTTHFATCPNAKQWRKPR